MHSGILADRSSPRRWWIVLAVVMAYGACVGARLTQVRYDISRFVVAGDRSVTPARLPYPIAVEAGSAGYDGQYFYRLALSPFDTNRDAYGISMREHPEVRAQRIVYPLAAWIVTLGRGRWVPYGLVAVNLLAMAALAWLAAALATHFELPTRAALLIPFFPGFVFSICRDTAEIPATALALAAMLAASRERWPLAAILASVAVLTRESTLLYLAGFALVAAARTLERRSLDRSLPWCSVPVVVYSCWQTLVARNWGSLSYKVVGHDDFSLPPLADHARALIDYGARAATLPVRYSVVYAFLSCCLFLPFVIYASYRLSRRPVRPAVVVPWLSYTVMAAFFSSAVWRDPWGYVRILDDAYAVGIVALIAGRDQQALRRLSPYVGAAWLASVAFAL